MESGASLSNQSARLYADQVKQVYRQHPVGLIANVVNSSILLFIHWKVIPHPLILGWFFSLLGLTLVKSLVFHRYRRADITLDRAPRWGKLFIIGTALSGIIWGAAGILLFPTGADANQIFTAFVLGGMTAGAAATFSALRGAFPAFCLPALIPIGLKALVIGDDIHIAIGAMVFLFLALMLVTSNHVHKITRSSLMLGYEKQSLIEYLTEAKESAERLNVKLEAEIRERQKVEAELKEHQERLEIMVRERTVELEMANQELQLKMIQLKRVTDALRESEEKYRLLVDHANEAVFIAQDGVVKFPNPMFTTLSGYSAEEAAEVPFVNLIHPADRTLVLERHQQRLRQDDIPNNYSFRIVTKSGEKKWVDINAVRITWEGRPATLNLVRDITEKKKLEERFLTAQKMEAIGTLAGGIAHDFNNLLMAIQGNTSLLMSDLPLDHPDYDMLRNIERYIRSGSELTRQLLGFARGGKYEVKPIDVNELLQKTAHMFGRTRKEIQIHIKLQANIWTVEADRGQIEQALLNLYINAWQAMTSGGDLFLETENLILDQNGVKHFDTEPGRYVRISVADTGAGMDKKTQKRIFDPFFTTQEMGRGTGLGLASVYGIIKNHGGFISLYSEQGTGTTFHIYLKASKKEIQKDLSPPQDIYRGKGTVLVVDDEEMIVRVCTGLLEKMGFDVLAALSGKEAVAVYRANRDDIVLVILDMIMPEVGGKETYDRLKALDPDVKVLLSSGYSINGQANLILGSGANGFIQKPFSMRELSRKIQAILNEN